MVALPAPGLPSSARRWRYTLVALSLADLRQDRELTLTGLVKWILEPLSFVVVYVLLVQVIFNRGTPKYPLFVLCAVLPWQFFQGVVTGSTILVLRAADVISNRAFPLTVLPPSLLVKEGCTFLIALAIMLPLMAVFGAGPSFALLWLPVIVAALGLLTAGPAYLGTVFGVYLPDFRVLAINLSRVLFLASTALVRHDAVPGDTLPSVLRLNPLSGIFDATRGVVMNGRAPGAFELLYPSAVGLALLVPGVALYRALQHQFPKEL